MRKLFYSIVLLSLTIMGCSKDDSQKTNTQTSIVAKWTQTKIVYAITNPNLPGEGTSKDSSAPIGAYLDFRDNGKVYRNRITPDGLFIKDTASYSINGNNLTYTDGTGSTFTQTIITLTANALVLYDNGASSLNNPSQSEEWDYFSK